MIIAVNFQFRQLKRRRLKNIRASTGFEPPEVAGSNPVEALIFFRLLVLKRRPVFQSEETNIANIQARFPKRNSHVLNLSNCSFVYKRDNNFGKCNAAKLKMWSCLSLH